MDQIQLLYHKSGNSILKFPLSIRYITWNLPLSTKYITWTLRVKIVIAMLHINIGKYYSFDNLKHQ